MISCVIDVRPLLKTKQTQASLTHPTVNIYTVDLPVDLRWTTTNKARAKGLHGAALENYLINWSCDVGPHLTTTLLSLLLVDMF